MNTILESFNIRDFLTILFKYKRRVVVVFFAIVIAVTGFSFALTPVYEAKTSLLVKLGRENVYQPEVGERGQQISVNAAYQAEVINSEIKILTTKELLAKVIEVIGVERLYPDLRQMDGRLKLSKAVSRFEENLTAEPAKKSNVIEVSFRHEDPETASKVLGEKHLKVFSDPKSSFLEKQVTEYGGKLDESEGRLQAFKQQNRVYSVEEQRALLLRQRMELDSGYKNTQNTIYELRQRLSSLKAQQKTMAQNPSLYLVSGDGARIVTDARSKLLDLQLKEQELLSKYRETSPMVVNVQREIQMAKGLLREQEENIKRTGNPLDLDIEKEKVKVEADLRAQEAKAEVLKQQVGQVEGTIKALDFREREFQNLKRNVMTTEQNYKSYLEKYEEARIVEDMNRRKMANISILSAPTVSAEPVKPKKMYNIILSILIGAVASLGIATISETMSQVVSTPHRAEKYLGLSALASIPLKKAI
jgi:uncharacterized protein involved in exopolysaccharide biosynthesis